jgi:hypothetical protein
MCPFARFSQAPPIPNDTLVDSTDNVLSHESFETISDPDGDAWTNNRATVYLFLDGIEIADECVFFTPDFNFFDVPTVLMGSHRYAVQLVNSNEQHACSSAP